MAVMLNSAEPIRKNKDLPKIEEEQDENLMKRKRTMLLYAGLPLVLVWEGEYHLFIHRDNLQSHSNIMSRIKEIREKETRWNMGKLGMLYHSN